MRRYLQYLVGSQKIQYLQQQPDILKKKFVSEELKNRSCLVSNSVPTHSTTDDVIGKTTETSTIESSLFFSQGIPIVKVEFMMTEVLILSYDSQIIFQEEDLVRSINNVLPPSHFTNVLKEEVERYLNSSEEPRQDFGTGKAKYYILFPREWFRYIKHIRPKVKETQPSKGTEQDSSSTSSFFDSVDTDSISPTSNSDHGSSTLWKTVNTIQLISKINVDNELFRKPCFSFVLPHSGALYVVTSIGIEVFDIPELSNYLLATRFDTNGETEVPRETPSHETSLSSSKSSKSTQGSPTKSNQATPKSSQGVPTGEKKFEKKMQKKLWSTIHLDLSHSNVNDMVKPISIHICACLIQDRNLVACGDSDGYIRIYSLQNRGALLYTIPSIQPSSSNSTSSNDIAPSIESELFFSPHNGPIVEITHIPSNDEIITAGVDGTCRVWNIKQKRLVRLIVPPSFVPHMTNQLLVKPHSQMDQKAASFIFPPNTNKRSQSSVISPVTCIDIDTKLYVLTVGHLSGEISQYRISTGERVFAIGNNRESQIVKALSVLSQSQFLVFANEKQLVRVWDVLLEREHNRFNCNTSQKFVYTSRKDVLFICTENGEVMLQKGVLVEILKRERQLQLVNTLKLHSSGIVSIWYHPDCDLLVTMSSNGQVAITVDVISDTFAQLDEKMKSRLMDNFFDYNIQVSSITDENRQKLLEELNSSEAVQEETSYSKIFHHTQREESTFKTVLESLKLQSRLQPENQRLKFAIQSVEYDASFIHKYIQDELESTKVFLGQNHEVLRTKYHDYIDPNLVDQTKELIVSNFETEKDEMMKRHAMELEALRERHSVELNEFVKKKEEETSNAARSYFSVKQAYNERIKSLDIECAQTYKKLLSRLDICPVQQFIGLDPKEYKILSHIGENSSRAFQAISFKLQDIVVIKALPPGIQLCDYLEHDRLVHVHEILCTNSHTFVVMEKIKSNLRQYLHDDGGFLKKQIIQQIIFDLLCALEYLHSQGMVHRDIRPENIYIDSQGRAYLSHLGIMKGLSFENETSEDGVWFSAPEVYMNSISFASDTWSVGIVFAFLLQTEQERLDIPLVPGKNPKEIIASGIEISCASGDDVASLFGQKVTQSFPPSSNGNPFIEKISCASEIEVQLLRSFLAFNPNKRLSASELKSHPYFNNVRR